MKMSIYSVILAFNFIIKLRFPRTESIAWKFLIRGFVVVVCCLYVILSSPYAIVSRERMAANSKHAKGVSFILL